jgi:thioester reductase-like protein
MGGTSLMVTNVLVEAEKRGLKFSYGEVFVYPTARAMAAHLSGETPLATAGTAIQTADADVSKYDYTAIDQLLTGNTLEALAGEPQPLGKHILLTGATGFLGVHMLRELIDQTPEDTTVWCLLRGKGPTLTAEMRLAQMLIYYFSRHYRNLIGTRIRVVEGDITKPESFEGLLSAGEQFDLVVNCAANVKHFSKGNDIEQINYDGVKNLVAFCEKENARFIQVSTESVAGMNPGEKALRYIEQQLYIGQNTDNQYVHSKFLAERHVLEHMAAGTLRAKIMRAGNLSPRAEDGEFQANFNANTTMGRIKAYRMLGACPYALLQSKMEFSPIDETAKAMVLLSRTPDACCVFHVSNDHLLPMDDILSRVQLDDGSPLTYVEFPEFMARMEAAKADPEKAKVLSSIIAYTQAPGGPAMTPNKISTDYTMQVLHRLGFRWDETSSQYVDMIFDMLASLRYFEV